VVLFGGMTRVGARYDDMWEFDGEGWTQLTPREIPSPRTIGALAYAPDRLSLVAYGGSGVDMVQLGDTWELNGNTWSETTPDASPLGRWTSAFAYDPSRALVVMFGGVSFSVADDTWTFLNDTWEYGSGM
jgi:hypothetical protein